MRRVAPLFWAIDLMVLAAACGSGSSPDAAGVDPVHTTRSDLPRSARHGGAIDRLAVVGSVAVTQDGSGGTRFWPSFDGSREPLVVPLGDARELVIGRDLDGYVIGVLDEVGGLELVRVAADGTVRSRAQVGADPAITSVAISRERVIAMRADHTIAILDATGEQRARLVPAFGERIEHLFANAEHALVVLSRAGKVYVRRVAGASWGIETPALQVRVDESFVMSPDATRLARGTGSKADVVELATGRVREIHVEGVPIGFFDADTLVTTGLEGLELWNLTRGLEVKHAMKPEATMYRIGDGVVVGGVSADLRLITRTRGVQHLGYSVAAFNNVREVDNQLIAIDGSQQLLVLGANLELVRRLRLPEDPRTLVDLVPIDNRYVLALHTIANSSHVVSVLDRAEGRTVQALTTSPMRSTIRYEPTTQLIELTDNGGSFLARLDRKTMSFETWYRVSSAADDVYLVDPAQSGGLAAIALRRDKVAGELVIDEIAIADLDVGETVKPVRSTTVKGLGHFVDRTGRVFVVEGRQIVVYERGREVRRIATDEGMRVPGRQAVPSPDGMRVAVYAGHRINMYGADGTLRWSVANPLARSLSWRGDDLLVNTYTSLVMLDAQTGAIKQRVCGWGFGLSALPHRDITDGESSCDAN